MPTYNFEKQSNGNIRLEVDNVYKRTFIGATLIDVVDVDSFDIIDSNGGRHRYELTQKSLDNNTTPNSFEIAGEDITGTVEDICKSLDVLFPKANSSSGGSGSISSPTQQFASNADAVAALGVGKLYISSTLSTNGSPHILITV